MGWSSPSMRTVTLRAWGAQTSKRWSVLMVQLSFRRRIATG